MIDMIDISKINKKTNKFIVMISSDNSYIKNLSIDEKIINKFTKEMISKNWDMETKTVKEYTYKNQTLKLVVPTGEQFASFDVFLRSYDPLKLDNDLYANYYEVNSILKKINFLNLSFFQKLNYIKIKLRCILM